MQQGYGSEFQQFMVDASSLFSISSSAHPPAAAQPLHHPQAPPLPPAAALHPHPHHYAHYHFTQQLFQQQPTHHHHFQLFNHSTPHHQAESHDERAARLLVHQQLGLDHESGPENSGGGQGNSAGTSAGGGGGREPPFLAAAMGFKLAVEESGAGAGDDDDILAGNGGGGEEESAIKEPSWRPLDIDYISSNNNKRCKEKEQEAAAPPSPHPPPAKYFKKSDQSGGGHYKLYSELEAIYKPGSSTGFIDIGSCSGEAGGRGGGGGGGDCAGGGGGGNQTGSGSALTGDENPLITEPVGVGSLGPIPTETSAGEEAVPVKRATAKGSGGSDGRRKRRRQRRLSSLAAFFERLVRQLVDHQEALHRRFLDSMERREQERANREEAWRLQEATKASREAAARAQERALATAREAAIVSFLEKITGETIDLPTKPDLDTTTTTTDNNNNNNAIVPMNADIYENRNHDHGNEGNIMGQFSTSRWPKTEVQALIGVRSGLESRFQEPGLKGPLWEEVSARMSALGYRRSAKRCKEKWENINKYFRKAKESGKKRPQHSKTCPYFHQLDQLYSKSSYTYSSNSPAAAAAAPTNADMAAKGGSELLDAVVVPIEQMGSRDKESNGEDEEEEEDDNGERGAGGEGDSHGQKEHRTNESNLFF